ncbi:MAG: hypothetical protein JWP37_2954 [Mucilaginibacter sp.]|nr:hypothetical protein [Mucilaginibacter sp.]
MGFYQAFNFTVRNQQLLRALCKGTGFVMNEVGVKGDILKFSINGNSDFLLK